MAETVQAFPCKFERTRYTEHYLMKRVTEAQVQSDIVQLLNAYKVDATAVDAGGRRSRGRIVAAAAAKGIDASSLGKIKLGGELPKGFSDLEATLAPNGRALYIEVKAPAWLNEKGNIDAAAGKPSDDQLEFLFSKWRRGALVMVAWSQTDVMDYLGHALRENFRYLQTEGRRR